MEMVSGYVIKMYVYVTYMHGHLQAYSSVFICICTDRKESLKYILLDI